MNGVQTCARPISKGILEIKDIEIGKIRNYINWRYFFAAWKIAGDYSDISSIVGCDSCKAVWLANFPQEERLKAAEAMQLYKEANRMLDRLQEDVELQLSARIGFFKAYSENESIYMSVDGKNYEVPCLRQQEQTKGMKQTFMSLADFIAPKESNKEDYIGVFAITVGDVFMDLLKAYQTENDDYKCLLLQSLGDRLVEAASEWMHEKVRTEYRGYSKEENLSEAEIRKMHYQGIRPAVGYPSLPDQSLNFVLNEILDMNKIGITLTSHGAMYPNASVSGFYFANEDACYFMTGGVDEEQREEYRIKRNMSKEQVKQFLR